MTLSAESESCQKIILRPWPADTSCMVLTGGRWHAWEVAEGSAAMFAVKKGWSCQLFNWLHRTADFLRIPGVSIGLGGGGGGGGCL